MNLIARLAVPAALALAAFGAQAQGSTHGTVAESVLPSVAVAQQVTPSTPVAGNEYRSAVARSVLPSVETAMQVTPVTPAAFRLSGQRGVRAIGA